MRDDDQVIYGIEPERYGVEWFADWYLDPEFHINRAKADGRNQKHKKQKAEGRRNYACCFPPSAF